MCAVINPQSPYTHLTPIDLCHPGPTINSFVTYCSALTPFITTHWMWKYKEGVYFLSGHLKPIQCVVFMCFYVQFYKIYPFSVYSKNMYNSNSIITFCIHNLYFVFCIHFVYVYCITYLCPNVLPKTSCTVMEKQEFYNCGKVSSVKLKLF